MRWSLLLPLESNDISNRRLQVYCTESPLADVDGPKALDLLWAVEIDLSFGQPKSQRETISKP